LQIKDLPDFQPKPGTSYNIPRASLVLRKHHAPNFSNICKALQTVTSVRSLEIDFGLEPTDLQLLGESMAVNRSVRNIQLNITKLVDLEAFKKFSTSVKNNKTLKNITLNIESLNILGSTKGLHLQTKGFKLKLDIFDCRNPNEFFTALVEVLKSTNVTKLACIDDFAVFGSSHARSMVTGGSEFCNHVISQNTLKELHFGLLIDDHTFPYLEKIVAGTTSLRSLEISACKPAKIPDLVDALVKSNLRRLKIFALEENVPPEIWLTLARAIRSMEKLVNFEVRTTENIDVDQFLAIIRESESIRRMSLKRTKDIDQIGCKEISVITGLNKKLQNTRVADLITILFNIARDTSSPSSSSAHIHSIPRDVWPSIASFVSIPGVNLDFGDIARSIFKDRSVRRVINKPIKVRQLE
jgi:hypothetical protein